MRKNDRFIVAGTNIVEKATMIWNLTDMDTLVVLSSVLYDELIAYKKLKISTRTSNL